MHADYDEGDDAVYVLAETENYAVLTTTDAHNETVYNIELGNVTLHLFREEWAELLQLIREASAK